MEITVQSSTIGFWTVTFSNWLFRKWLFATLVAFKTILICDITKSTSRFQTTALKTVLVHKFEFTVKILLSKKNCLSCISKSHLKMIKNAFYFILKAPFVLKTFKLFVLTSWSCRKSGLIRDFGLISKFMTSQTGWQTITIRILPNISRSKGNQTLKFGQLIEYNRNIFLQKSCWK